MAFAMSIPQVLAIVDNMQLDMVIVIIIVIQQLGIIYPLIIIGTNAVLHQMHYHVLRIITVIQARQPNLMVP